MVLYTCPARKRGATGPLIKHPCGVAAKAGQDDVPVLVPDDGPPVVGSARIAEWARRNPH